MMTNSAGPLAARRRRPLVAAVLAFALLIGWQVARPLPAFADGPTTFSRTTSIAIPATGSADQIGPASPYPSTIEVSGMTGLISKVTVTFHNLSHGTMNDVDALVVAPSGQNLVVLSDIGDPASTLTTASNSSITFDDAAATGVPSGVRSGSETFRPTNSRNADGTANDAFPSPAPTLSTETTLAGAFDGRNPNGTWSLYIVDDGTGDTGSMAGGWSLTITTEVAAVATTTTVESSGTPSTTGNSVTFTASVQAGQSAVTSGTVQFSSDGTNIGSPVALNGSGEAAYATSALTEGTHLIRATYSGASGFLGSNGIVDQRVDNPTIVTGNTFCNAGPITIPGAGAASPYPSNITVSGLSGDVSKVTAQLKGVSHQAPIDMDILLSGPTPTRNVFLLSDAGGNASVSGLNLTFDDAAAGAVGTPFVSGTYRPTRIADESPESLPNPAPALSSATTLGTFNGASANGTWSLWVVDDASGDSGSISGGWCLTITTPAPTSTALTAVPNPSGFGESVTLTATVTSDGSPVTTGSVQFADGATELGTPVPVNASGVATFTTSALTAGTHQLTAIYEGTDEFAESSRQVTHVVNVRDTATALTSGANPADYGTPVTFTATVTADGGGAVDVGSVTFTVDGTAQPPVAVNASGVATFTTSTLSVGTHAIVARYGGTANYGTSQDTLSQVTSALESVTVVVSAPNPSTYGSNVTFTATVTRGQTPVDGGSVQFSEDGTPLGPPVTLLADGTGSITTSALAAGDHTIVATYSGTETVAGSSGSVNHRVDRLGTTVTLFSSAASADLDDPVTFTAMVAGSPVAVGSVVFLVDGAEFGVDELDAAGQATLTTSDLDAGSHQVVARYEGSPNHLGSESAPLTQVIRVVADAGGPYTVAEGESVTLDGGDSSSGLTYSWDVNDDGTFDVDGIGPTLTWAQLEALGINDGPGVHTVTLRVTAGAVSADATAVLTVVNSSPASVLTGDRTATVGVPFTIKVGADDPSSADMAAMFTYTVDWGDGSPTETVVGPADPPVTHTYTAAGTYDASFTATDKDGGTGAPTEVSVVAEPAPTPTPSPSPSASASPSPSPSQSESPSSSPSPSESASPTASSSPTPTSTATTTASPRPTATSDPDDDLPQTGTSADPGVLLIGLGLLAVGALVVVASIIGRRSGWGRRP